MTPTAPARTLRSLLAFTAALPLALVAGCGGPDLGANNNSSFNQGLSGNFSGFGGSNSTRAGATTAGLKGRGTYAKLEASFELPDVQGNPFDYTENNVLVTITRPDNQTVKIPAFFDGGPNNHTWRVRYTPDVTGRFAITKVTLNGREVTPSKIENREMQASGTQEPGFVRRDQRDKTHFAFDNGTTYYPLGHNAAWGEKPEAVAKLIEKLGANGENWSRIWMSHWGGLNLDWVPGKKTEPGQLDLDVARRWDQILDAADKAGVHFQMVLQHHGQWSTRVDPNWKDNPWNKANGGFLGTPDEFFTNPRAIALTKAKYRYILARYGYSPSIMAFELFNEVENTDAVAHQHADEVAAWHNGMAAFIREQDPNHHLITSSAGIQYAALGNQLDYWQPHAYPSDPVSTVTSVEAHKLDRPVFFGEIGPGDGLDKDKGEFLHRALWASIASETGGAAQYWSWETVEKNDLWPQLKAASDFVRSSGVAGRHGLTTTAASIETTERAPLSLTPGMGWAAAKQTEFTVLPSGETPGIGAMPAFLQGSAHREMFPAATFKLTCPAETTFSVRVGKVSKGGANLSILVDGTAAAQKAFPGGSDDTTVNATLEAKVPAGEHIVRLEDTGADWLTIQRITLSDYAPAVGAFGKAGKDYAMFWLTSRLPEKTDGVKAKLIVPGLQSGSYKVTWWDTSTGKQASEETLAASGGAVTVNTPAIARDMAVTIARTGEKTASKADRPEKKPRKGKAS